MDPPVTQYIDRDGAALAYQVAGDGPVDVVYLMDVFQHIDLQWTDPDIHHNYERVASFSRAVFFQPRGFGLSDRVSYFPTIEQQADDVLAVMDAVGVGRATLCGNWSTCGALALVAAKAPERASGLVFHEPLVQGVEVDDLQGWSESEASEVAAALRHAGVNWGSGQLLDAWLPAIGTAYNRRLMALLERCSATPTAGQSYLEWIVRTDWRDVMRSVQAPVRVLKTPETAFPEAAVRYATDLLPAGTFHMLPPTPRGSSLGQLVLPVLDHIEEMATGAAHESHAGRFLGTVLFTDVVSSTELLARVGDAEYRQRRMDHERLVRLAVDDNGGQLMTVTGDGTLSVFEGPSAAVRCAETICREADEAGIAVRAGIHTGELEREAMNVTGLAVHIGARVGAAAEPGEVLVSRTVHDLVAGSDLTFASKGEHELKGIPGSWELFAVTHADERPVAGPLETSTQTPMDKMVLQAARTTPGLMRAAVRLGNAIERRRARAG
jgi:class 3 adenylate cyclase/pimeloyl-ACP methyl ester carboxylesterase